MRARKGLFAFMVIMAMLVTPTIAGASGADRAHDVTTHWAGSYLRTPLDEEECTSGPAINYTDATLGTYTAALADSQCERDASFFGQALWQNWSGADWGWSDYMPTAASGKAVGTISNYGDTSETYGTKIWDGTSYRQTTGSRSLTIGDAACISGGVTGNLCDVIATNNHTRQWVDTKSGGGGADWIGPFDTAPIDTYRDIGAPVYYPSAAGKAQVQGVVIGVAQAQVGGVWKWYIAFRYLAGALSDVGHSAALRVCGC